MCFFFKYVLFLVKMNSPIFSYINRLENRRFYQLILDCNYLASLTLSLFFITSDSWCSFTDNRLFFLLFSKRILFQIILFYYLTSLFFSWLRSSLSSVFLNSLLIINRSKPLIIHLHFPSFSPRLCFIYNLLVYQTSLMMVQLFRYLKTRINLNKQPLKNSSINP